MVPTERSPGERLGPYELIRPLGRGGMGEVWMAELHGPGGFVKPVALKLVADALATDETLKDLLLREARLGARLQHPNVVNTMSVSCHADTWAVALELVRGASLGELVALGPLPPRAVLDVGTQVAAGLAHAHQHGLVHRDIKPGNLLVDRTGLVKVADMGISVLAGEAARVAGTAGYMAPEQGIGQALPASDLFALGATLYHLAMGQRPFPRGRITARIARDALASPGFSDRIDAVVVGLGPVLRACLQPDPTHRPPSARALGDQLAALRPRQCTEGPTLLQLLAAAVPGIAVETTPVQSAEVSTRRVPSGNLPRLRDAFVGRDEELRHLTTQLLAIPRPLVFLVGPGGMGKTRLALELAHTLQARLQGGAWALDLTEARSVDEVCRAVARGLAVDLHQGDPVDQLGHAFAARGQVLVLLDNLEQCVDALPGTVGRWAAMAPDVAFLGTSRITPRLRGETTVHLGPLSGADGQALFVARASREVRNEELADVAALVDELEGIPLAIELAAKRVMLLGVAEVRQRLSLAMLAGGSRELPERHRSLQASLDWSVDLLTPPAQRGLRLLGVFDGGFELTAAEAVLDQPGAIEVLDVLQELVEASLLRVDRRGRFSMLVVVREYASATCPADERGAAERRHGRHYAQLGSEASLTAAERTIVRSWLDDEVDNLVAACRRAVERDDGPVAVATLRATWAIVSRQGPFLLAAQLAAEVDALDGSTTLERAHVALVVGQALSAAGQNEAGAAPLERALQLAQELGNPNLQGLCHAHIGRNQQVGRPDDAAVHHYDTALQLLRGVGNLQGEARVLIDLANVHTQQGRHDLGRQLLEQVVAMLPRVGPHRLEGQVHGHLGVLHYEQSRNELAVEHFERGLEAHRRHRDQHAEAALLSNYSLQRRSQGQVEQSRALGERALALHRRMGDRRFEGIALGNLGGLHREQGRHGLARDLLEQALQIHRQGGHRLHIAVVLGNLANLDFEAGDLAAADARYTEALALHREGVHRRHEAIVAGNLAGLYQAQGRLQEALELFEESLQVCQELGIRGSEARTIAKIGRLHHQAGRSDDARTHYEAALEVLAEVEDCRFEGLVLAQLAVLVARDGEHDPALTLLDRADVLLRTVGDTHERGRLQALRGEVLHSMGDLEAARRAVDEASELAGERADVRVDIERVRGLLLDSS